MLEKLLGLIVTIICLGGCGLLAIGSGALKDVNLSGAQIPIVNVSWCLSKPICIHELGHTSDESFGFVSTSNDYKNALLQFVKDNPDHPWSGPIVIGSKVNGWKEMYAQMLESADGREDKMPYQFRQFYNWGLINEKMQKIVSEVTK